MIGQIAIAALKSVFRGLAAPDWQRASRRGPGCPFFIVHSVNAREQAAAGSLFQRRV